ncbi:hypothetical protein PR202_gb07854 [Eleusine coracana subsp. coracana]|uniref:Uncharacterized protein n=1 Tax=Eleusine coracana subsp. coracana TaxID=191504 RepID=A0AAV5EAQ7_ELECO|nr:hypothetical protein PR202_gb07854 [Eleusine coracana subsp. coracana]
MWLIGPSAFGKERDCARKQPKHQSQNGAELRVPYQQERSRLRYQTDACYVLARRAEEEEEWRTASRRSSFGWLARRVPQWRTAAKKLERGLAAPARARRVEDGGDREGLV